MKDGSPVAVDSNIVLHKDVSTALDGGSDGGAVGRFKDGLTVDDGVELGQNLGADTGIQSLVEGRLTVIIEGVDVEAEADEEPEDVNKATPGGGVQGSGARIIGLDDEECERVFFSKLCQICRRTSCKKILH